MGGVREESYTSSGYRSSRLYRGMCSVSPMVVKPSAMARSMMSSSWSFAWPGQNWPEWECIVKAILDIYPLCRGASALECVSCDLSVRAIVG